MKILSISNIFGYKYIKLFGKEIVHYGYFTVNSPAFAIKLGFSIEQWFFSIGFWVKTEKEKNGKYKSKWISLLSYYGKIKIK